MSNVNIYPVSGREFKAIREGSGYSAQEVAAYFSVYAVRQKWPMRIGKTIQTIYRLEAYTWVADKYVEALRVLVGEEAFLARLLRYRAKQEQIERDRQERKELQKQLEGK